MGALTSGLIAGILIAAAVHMRIGIQPGTHERFEVIALVMVEEIIALGVAIVLATVLAARRSPSAVARAAIVLAMLLVLGLGALEVFGLVTQSSAAFSRSNAFAEDIPFFVAVAAPGLLTILIQWWFVRRALTAQ